MNYSLAETIISIEATHIVEQKGKIISYPLGFRHFSHFGPKHIGQGRLGPPLFTAF